MGESILGLPFYKICSFLMVKDVVYCFFQLASSGWFQCIQPAPEFIPDSWFLFLAFLSSLLCWKSFIKTFQIKETVAEYDSLFGWKQFLICGSPFRRFLSDLIHTIAALRRGSNLLFALLDGKIKAH